MISIWHKYNVLLHAVDVKQEEGNKKATDSMAHELQL